MRPGAHYFGLPNLPPIAAYPLGAVLHQKRGVSDQETRRPEEISDGEDEGGSDYEGGRGF